MLSTTDTLGHIPHLPTKPLIGHTKYVIDDFLSLVSRSTSSFGEVYRVKVLGSWRIHFTSPAAAEYILTDPDNIFSSKLGWADAAARIFPGSLVLKDFDDHRQHRRIMQAAFSKSAMDSYQALMSEELELLVNTWPENQSFTFHDAIKALTLQMGSKVFMGLPSDDDGADELNAALVDQLGAIATLIRKPIPFTPFRKGLKARELLANRFGKLVEVRRDFEGGDFFTQMCQAKDEQGRQWNDQEIVEHFGFLLMAAHDTTASALTTMIWALTEHPEWQEKLYTEVQSLGIGPMTKEIASNMPLTDWVFKEALRFMPPVPIVPRVALNPFEWKGIKIPAGSAVTANITMIMRSPECYTDPEKFDPERFSPTRAEDQCHRFAWLPFGGGAHKCIGMHFASIQVKSFMRVLLTRYRVQRVNPDTVLWRRIPTARPKCGLPVVLVRR